MKVLSKFIKKYLKKLCLLFEEENELLFSKYINDEDVAFEKCHIPSMSHFKAAFLYLKSEIKQYGEEAVLDIWSASKAISRGYNTDCTSLMLNIILCVFDELGLISINRIKNGVVGVILNKTEGKVNIEQSSILASIKTI